MENSSESVLFFEERIDELNELLNHAEANASKELITKAINYTIKSMDMLIVVNENSIEYINYLDNEVKYSIKEIEDLLKQLQKTQAELLNSGMPTDFLLAVSDPIHSQLISSVELTKKKYYLSMEMLILTKAFLRNLLLDEIFKPKKDEFNYNKVFKLLEYLASKLIPGLDELKIFRDFTKPAILIKKEFLNQGDKLLIYLEEYIDAVKKWCDLSEKLAYFYNMPVE